jgi:hypothetical protein
MANKKVEDTPEIDAYRRLSSTEATRSTRTTARPQIFRRNAGFTV